MRSSQEGSIGFDPKSRFHFPRPMLQFGLRCLRPTGESEPRRYGSPHINLDSIMSAKHAPSLKPVDELTLPEARAEHEDLGREIAEHDRRYYEDDAPTVSDAEY